MFRKVCGWNVSWTPARGEPWVGRALFALSIALGATIAQGAERSAERVVNEVCASCHQRGEKGAPIIGNDKSWADRKAKGLSELTQHAIQGLRNMPSHGGDAGLSSAELERAITYMVNRSGGDWVEPVDKGKSAPKPSGEQIVKAKCATCHVSGKDGAPRIGDRDAWVGRLSEGLDKVVASGIHGRGAMPARGGMAGLSDAEMRAAVIYMFNASIGGQKKQ